MGEYLENKDIGLKSGLKNKSQMAKDAFFIYGISEILKMTA